MPTSGPTSGRTGDAAGGPVDTPLHLDPDESDGLSRWFDLAWRVLDVVTSDAPVGPGWATVQLWPEHFDAGTTVDLGGGAGINLGFSGGDAFSDEPYVYVGPWGPERPGDPGYWNAPFGAFVPRCEPATRRRAGPSYVPAWRGPTEA